MRSLVYIVISQINYNEGLSKVVKVSVYMHFDFDDYEPDFNQDYGAAEPKTLVAGEMGSETAVL